MLHCRAQLLIIQNPPAVPTFMVVWFFSMITRKSVVVDWHNYGYTIMGLNSSLTSPITRYGFYLRYLNNYFLIQIILSHGNELCDEIFYVL